MSKVWVLGAGQLGAMLHHAALPLGVEVIPVDIEEPFAVEMSTNDVVTAEREQWPETGATVQLANHPHFLNRTVFPCLADRYTQKQLLDELEIATAPWQLVTAESRELTLFSVLGSEVLLKRRTGGYDGRGQFWLKQSETSEIPAGWRNEAIAEQKIPFDEEVSLVGARDKDGNLYFYPLTLNLHVNGILMASVAPLSRLNTVQTQAEQMLGKLLTHLDYVGVMAMECFRVGDHLMVNELAPRVHNSGHWTQSGASISQFEYHIRAVVGLPMAPVVLKGQSVMINLVGCERNNCWLAVPGAELYWYNKEVRVGRKVGHINLTGSSLADLESPLDKLQGLFDLPVYQDVFAWVKCQIQH